MSSVTSVDAATRRSTRSTRSSRLRQSRIRWTALTRSPAPHSPRRMAGCPRGTTAGHPCRVFAGWVGGGRCRRDRLVHVGRVDDLALASEPRRCTSAVRRGPVRGLGRRRHHVGRDCWRWWGSAAWCPSTTVRHLPRAALGRGRCWRFFGRPRGRLRAGADLAATRADVKVVAASIATHGSVQLVGALRRAARAESDGDAPAGADRRSLDRALSRASQGGRRRGRARPGRADRRRRPPHHLGASGPPRSCRCSVVFDAVAPAPDRTGARWLARRSSRSTRPRASAVSGPSSPPSTGSPRGPAGAARRRCCRSCAAAVRLDSPRPGLFRQTRVGRDGRAVHGATRCARCVADAEARQGRADRRQRVRRRAVQDEARPARHPGRAPSCASPRSTSSRSCSTCCAATCRWSVRGRSCRPRSR